MANLAVGAINSILLFILLNCVTKLAGDKGKVFLLAFSKDHSEASVYVSMIVRGQKSAQVSVNCPGNPDIGSSRFLLTSNNERATIFKVETSLIANESSRYYGNCVLIKADNLITVVVFSNFTAPNLSLVSGSSFMAIPQEHLSTSYIAVTSCKLSVCFILVASQEMNTDVEAVLTLRALEIPGGTISAEIWYNEGFYGKGDVIHEELQAWDSFQILGKSVDLTGTRISSNKPIAVFSGGVFDEGRDSEIKDKVIEQMPPVECLGQTYMLRGPHNWPDRHYKVLIAKLDPGTEVEKVGNIELIKPHALLEVLSVGFDQTVTLMATKPVLVVLEFPARRATHAELPDFDSMGSSFLLAVPVARWKRRYRAYLFGIPFQEVSHQAVLMASTQCHNDKVKIRGRGLSQLTWNTVDSENNSGSIEIPSYEGDILIDHQGSKSCNFGGYIFSYTDSGTTWAYPFGWNSNECEKPVQEHVSSRRHSKHDSSTDTNSKQTVFRNMFQQTLSISHNSGEIFAIMTPSHKHVAVEMSSTFRFSVAISQQSSQELIETRMRTPYNTETSSIESLLTKVTHAPAQSVQRGEVSRTLLPSSTVKRYTEETLALSTTRAQTGVVDLLSLDKSIEIFSTTSQMNIRQTTTAHSLETTATTQFGALTYKDLDTTVETPTAETLDHVRMPHTTTTWSINTRQNPAQSSTVLPDLAVEPPDDARKDFSAESDSTGTENGSNSYTLVLCPCECTSDLDWIANMTTEEKEEQTKAIVRALQVDKSNVSKTIRKKTSAPDKRSGPTYYGSFITGILLVSLFSFIVVPDILSTVYHIFFKTR